MLIFNIKTNDNDISLNIKINKSVIIPEKPNEKYGFNNKLNEYRNKISLFSTCSWLLIISK